MSTLRYANRAKNIKNKPKINEDPKDAMLREFQDEIARLKAQLQGKGTYDENGEWQGAASASRLAVPSTRVHRTMTWVVSFWILRLTEMLRAGTGRPGRHRGSS